MRWWNEKLMLSQTCYGEFWQIIKTEIAKSGLTVDADLISQHMQKHSFEGYRDGTRAIPFKIESVLNIHIEILISYDR